ncbi:domon domain-containing protein frrs1l [Plakobranchus ocellatus]|uniref:Domon domain-containing protein frrs1l n=1 Tax=Plakobranchus ocellatus TaxID=259542 RepID=A0AAV4B2V3_9GAST|nr:domon domain-containing protein frrs1l [Plakobranchus ocellatus]
MHLCSTVVLHACPIVKKMVLQLRSAGFVRQYPRRRFFSCLRVHDTVVLFRPSGRQIVSVRPPVSWKGLKDTFSVAWNYEIATDQNTTEWFFGQEKIDVDETQPKVRYSECGSHWSCVRIGEPGCGHMSCDYLLTYTFENRSKLILEMSGKSDGWVGLGLSSDNKMGGDEVVACKRKSSKGRQLEAFSGWISQPHSRPEKKTDGNFELIKQEHKDGYIFCKMIRTVKINEVGGDTSLDLTAKWYQMYTRGQVDNRGAMLRYKEILTSKDPVSMLEPFQIDSTDFGQLEFSQETKKSQRDADARLAGSRLHCCYSYITSLAFFIIMLLA